MLKDTNANRENKSNFFISNDLTVMSRAKWLLFYFIFVSNSIRELTGKDAANFRQAVRTLT